MNHVNLLMQMLNLEVLKIKSDMQIRWSTSDGFPFLKWTYNQNKGKGKPWLLINADAESNSQNWVTFKALQRFSSRLIAPLR